MLPLSLPPGYKMFWTTLHTVMPRLSAFKKLATVAIARGEPALPLTVVGAVCSPIPHLAAGAPFAKVALLSFGGLASAVPNQPVPG